jgi:hypothetical protein
MTDRSTTRCSARWRPGYGASGAGGSVAVISVDTRQRVHAEMVTPMYRARICVRCECVFDKDYIRCPRCGGAQIAPVALWLADEWIAPGLTGSQRKNA